MKKVILLICGFFACLFLVSSAYAASYSIDSLFAQYSTTDLDILEDSSGEIWLDMDGSNTINVDDILISLLSLESINNTAIGTAQYEEVTAILAIEIDSSVYYQTEGTDPNTYDLYRYTASGLEESDLALISLYCTDNSILDLSTYLTFVDDSTTQDEVAVVYVDESPDADNREDDLFIFMESHVDGDEVMTLSIDTAIDALDHINVIAPDDLTELAFLNAQQAIFGSSIDIDLTIEDNWEFVDFDDNDIYSSSGSFSKAGDLDAADILNQISFTVNGAVVPEPSTMLLFGFGLLSLAGIGRKRRNK